MSPRDRILIVLCALALLSQTTVPAGEWKRCPLPCPCPEPCPAPGGPVIEPAPGEPGERPQSQEDAARLAPEGAAPPAVDPPAPLAPQQAQQPMFAPQMPQSYQSAATGGRSISPNMLGDSLAGTILTHQSGPSDSSAVSLYSFHAFKISEDESPWPRNRVYFDVNSYNNVPGTEDLTRFLLGMERTFADGDASIGLRVPVWLANPEAPNANPGESPFGAPSHSSAFGDLTITLKGALLSYGRTELLSAGLSITTPTGPDTYGGVNPYYTVDHVDHKGTIQPWLGWYLAFNTAERGLFTQGFAAYDQAFDTDDAGLFYFDMALGYRIPKRSGFVTAITPMFEAHWSNPLHNRTQEFTRTPLGLAAGHPAGGTFAYRHQVNLTTAVNLEFNNTTTLALGIVVPTVGPRFMDFELLAQLNLYAW